MVDNNHRPNLFMRSLSPWVLASRPFSLSASIVPVMLGSAMAARLVDMRWGLFFLTLIGAVLIQVATNLIDEYTDHRRSGGKQKFLAPHKVIARGILSERAVFCGITISLALAIGMGLYIVSQAGWPILIVGLVSVPVAYFYSAGPYPLGNLGMGELIVFFFMGPLMVMAAYFVQTQALSWNVFWISIPVGIQVTSIMHCNNLRDLEEDRLEGKHTLALLLGARLAKWAYIGMLIAVYGPVGILVFVGSTTPLALLALSTLPWATKLVIRIWRATERPEFNQALVNGAKLHGITGLSLAGGIALHTFLSN